MPLTPPSSRDRAASGSLTVWTYTVMPYSSAAGAKLSRHQRSHMVMPPMPFSAQKTAFSRKSDSVVEKPSL